MYSNQSNYSHFPGQPLPTTMPNVLPFPSAQLMPNMPPVASIAVLPQLPDPNVIVPPMTNCPIGLEYLTQINQLRIEKLTEHRTPNKTFETRYVIKNMFNQDIYFTDQDLSCSCKDPGVLNFFDNMERRVIVMDLPTKGGTGCCGCGDVEFWIRNGQDHPIGRLKASRGFARFQLNVFDTAGIQLYRIKRSQLFNSNRNDFQYSIVTSDGSFDLGKVKRVHTHESKRIYELNFPLDLEACSKALLIASVFVIDANTPTYREPTSQLN